MSWFGSFAELERASRVESGREIAPGVVVARRAFVFGAMVGGAALLGGCRSSSPRLTVVDEEQTLEDLVHTMRPRARVLIAEQAPDEEAYLEHVARSLVRLPRPRVGVEDVAVGKWKMDNRCWFPPIAVFEMRLAPGAQLGLHDHRDYNGVLSCARGSVRCANYDIVGDVLAARALNGDEPFVVARISESTLRIGDVSTLSRGARNLHELEAGSEGAVLYDVFTYFDASARSHDVELGPAISAAPDRFEARWKRG